MASGNGVAAPAAAGLPAGTTNVMTAGTSGGAYGCGPGCAVAGHKHGATSEGAPAAAGTGSGPSWVEQMRADLLRNAADQEAGRGHIAKHKEWFEGVETDLRKIMAGTDDQAQFDKLVGLVRRMGQLIAEAERLLPLSIAETRALAARR